MPHKWIDPVEVIVSDSLKNMIEGHALISETLVRRGIINPDQAQAFLYTECYIPTPANAFPDINKVVIRINDAIVKRETILVWGDFDVDGQTSTTILVEALKELGANVIHHIPVRATEGHGIKVDVLNEILNETSDNIQLLLTCDTGISAHEAIQFAKKIDLDVIITDHHDLPEELPAAFAIINPKQLSDDHPLATLPGVGVAYKLVEALFDQYCQTDHRAQFPDQSNLSTYKFLDLVALGIVADLADQHGDTRYLLQLGLKVLQNTKRLGLKALMNLAQINPAHLDEGIIGFGIAPRLNALGRLSDANPIVEFFTTKDPNRAQFLATQLERLNERRKLLTEQITQAALRLIDQDKKLLDKSSLILAQPDWHTGVIGIVASRIVERFGKPTILLSIGDDEIARGSARSIESVDITEAIASQKDLLLGFGGHAGAAGLSLPAENIPQFRRGIEQALYVQLGDQSTEPFIQIDAYLPITEVSIELANEIEQLAPFGAGNPPLVLVSRNLNIVNHSIIGSRKEHLRIVVVDDAGNHLNLLWWNGVGNPLPETEFSFDLAYNLHTSTYRGERQLQVLWVDHRLVSKTSQQSIDVQPTIEIIDLRQETDPITLIKTIQRNQKVQVWAEGEAKSKLGGVDRNELSPGIPLVVWTTPPSRIDWQRSLEQVKPDKIYIFAVDPLTDDPKLFLERLAGLVKFSLNAQEGKIYLENLSAATCQQENTVRMGLLWLEAKGFIEVLKLDEDAIWLGRGSGIEGSNLAEIWVDLLSILTETAAYRAYFRNTQKFLT